MAEDEKSTYGVAPRLVQEFIGQLQAITGKLGDQPDPARAFRWQRARFRCLAAFRRRR